ncbi:MAG: phosphoenolpyruvate synthase, partial [Chloroflexi bacterium]|nr:phosphoenolpyruvate synthase [Chloroflexota bacterium]
MPFILPFNSLQATLHRVGGKGANLSELTRAGFNVPPGFLITTDAYRAFVSENGLQAKILALVAATTLDDPASLDSASEKIRALFDQAAIPNSISAEIQKAHQELSNHLITQSPNISVAVRSSATAEDLPGLSFAGQQDTFLNIIGTDAVLDAVKKCWSSLWTARAIGYRARNGIAPENIALAVVVQEMVVAESSGILFTANPVTGCRAEMVIDASFGLGEAIVSGQVEPDHYVVDAGNWQITQKKLGAKAMAILPRVGGGTEQKQLDAAQQQALDDARIVELARVAESIAQHFGAPQDIEWAYAREQLFILQARPITSLYPLPNLPHDPSGFRVLFSINSIQGVPGPITPFGRNALQMLLGGVLKNLRITTPIPHVIVEAGGRLYLDITPLTRDPRLRHFARALLTRADPVARQIVFRLIEDGRVPTIRTLTPARTFQLFRFLASVAPRIQSAIHSPEKFRVPALKKADQFVAEMRARLANAKTSAQVLAQMEADFGVAFANIVLPIMPAIIPPIGIISTVDSWLVEWLGEKPGAALKLMRGLPNNVTTEMDLKLWRVAQKIRASDSSHRLMSVLSIEKLIEYYRAGQLPDAAQKAISGFLAEYGMRAVTEIDIGKPRWRGDPAPLFQTLRSYLMLSDPQLAPNVVFARSGKEAEEFAKQVVARVRKTHNGWIRARVLGGVIRRIRALAGLRETPKFYLIKILDLYRSA